ncbi:high affinity copper uptake protein 1 [Culicoides brevitarsis]|uniref:high affinity copper uptake protein 1 n=1 Tax=Culicoides brevitarsis TaxID=469753 RepID=UPI00307B853A
MDHSHHHHHDEIAASSESPMDHSAHHKGHDDSSTSPMQHAMHHMMSMAFHGGCNETILFEQWKTSSWSGLVFSMFIIFILATLYEGLKYYREHLFWKSYNALQYRAVTLPEKNVVTQEDNRVVHMVGEVIHKQPPSICSLMHYYQTFLHLVQITLSYALMLIFMVYNVWLCLAVVVGATFGYFLFGWKKSVIVDVTEHCH